MNDTLIVGYMIEEKTIIPVFPSEREKVQYQNLHDAKNELNRRILKEELEGGYRK